MIIHRMYTYFIYMLSSRSRTVYVGMTNDLTRRLYEHRAGMVAFTTRYDCTRLVYVECTSDVWAAIAREKQLKNWRRAKKIALIESTNPAWDDLAPIAVAEGADPSTRSARSG
ncbi:MAG: GIY-YIG nuclease family protein [Gemmatimonadota bacterium]